MHETVPQIWQRLVGTWVEVIKICSATVTSTSEYLGSLGQSLIGVFRTYLLLRSNIHVAIINNL